MIATNGGHDRFPTEALHTQDGSPIRHKNQAGRKSTQNNTPDRHGPPHGRLTPIHFGPAGKLLTTLIIKWDGESVSLIAPGRLGFECRAVASAAGWVGGTVGRNMSALLCMGSLPIHPGRPARRPAGPQARSSESRDVRLIDRFAARWDDCRELVDLERLWLHVSLVFGPWAGPRQSRERTPWG